MSLSQKLRIIPIGLLLLTVPIVSGCRFCSPEQVSLEAVAMSVAIYKHDLALKEIMDTDSPQIAEENLATLQENYEEAAMNSVPKCAESTQSALLQTLELGIHVAELKIQNASDAKIQAALQELEENRELFDTEYYELTN